MEKSKNKKRLTTPVYYLIIFVLSIAVGYYAKLLATKYVTIGFDDDKIQTSQSDYNFKDVASAVEKARQAEATSQEAAAQGQADAAASGGTCSAQ